MPLIKEQSSIRPPRLCASVVKNSPAVRQARKTGRFHYPAPRYTPHTTVPASNHSQKLARTQWASCPTCGKTFCGAALVRDEPMLVVNWGATGYTGPLVVAKLFCDHCDHIAVTAHALTGDGEQIGEQIGEPGFLYTDKLIEAFLKANPQAAGVEQS